MGTSSPSTASVGWPYHVPLTLPAYPANPNSRTVLRPVATHYWRRRGPNGRNSTGIRKCTQCQTTSTRAWRPGPQGSATLCDRCGKKYKRKIAHHARSASPTQSPRSSGSSSYCITPPPLDLASNPIMESGHTPTSHHHELFLKLLN
ncbi:hypothetical protein IWQ62_004977 [Dispira parvispora]|uniref:GATA-type domain-containing protein n=1 Tax=Dispira parvispora TaxID=1520584 RepID=A0A9W8ARP0_9FUNG|nr:hypothetical protein IWQ62_004977 [Dispira parvispora]